MSDFKEDQKYYAIWDEIKRVYARWLTEKGYDQSDAVFSALAFGYFEGLREGKEGESGTS